MKKTFAIALAAAVGVVGLSEGVSPAAAAGPAPAPTLDQIRGDALARMNAGDLEQVQRRGRAGRGYRGGRSFGGRRNWRGNRGYARRGYSSRRYYGGRRGYGGRGYYGRRRGGGGAVAAGIAGLAAGAIIAGATAPRYSRGSSWCAQRYRSYNPRTGTYVGYDGVRRSCP